MRQAAFVAPVALFVGACLTVSVFAQGLGLQPDAHRTRKAPPVNNQFNLPAYSPMLMPYAPPLGATFGAEQPIAPHHPMHSTHPRLPPQQPIAPAHIAFFCPQLGGYYPAVQHCPSKWVRVYADPFRRSH